MALEYSNDYKNPNWINFLSNGIDIVTPAGSFNKKSIDNYPQVPGLWATNVKDYHLELRISNAFWNGNPTDILPSDPIWKESDPSKIEGFMRDRLKYLFSFKPNRIDIVLEPWYYNQDKGSITWNASPYYKAFGEGWIKKAFRFAEEEAQKQGLTPGKDVKFYWNDYKLDQPGPNVDMVYKYIAEMRNEGLHIDGVGLQIYPGEIQSYSHVPQKDEMKSVIRKFSEFGDVYLEFEVWRSQGNKNVEPVGKDVFDACIEMNKEAQRMICNSIYIWDKFERDDLQPVLFTKNYEPNVIYQNLLKHLISRIPSSK